MDGDFLQLCTIGLAIGVGAMSPGASFLLATRVALSSPFSASLGVAIGLGSGAMIFAFIALFGLQAVLNIIPGLHQVLNLLGGGYLLWRAVNILNKKPQMKGKDLATPTLTFTQALFRGLLTQLSNPNTAVVFASLFTPLLDHPISTIFYFTVPGMTFFIDFLWFIFVAIILSQALPKRVYLRNNVAIDRLSAGILGFLGLKLLLK
ncbi:LysE family translocator [Rosenbergiella epipactidis]|uniref:LysE family translocator n=1 Tax=Rosenbergiella epipactidis TaxID=1544694 RepID=UPI001F4DCFBB